MEIKVSVMPLEATQPWGFVQSKREDDGTVKVVLYYSEEADDTNLDCSDDDKDLAVAYDDIPFGEYHHGDDNEILDSIWHDKTDGWNKIPTSTRDNDDPCRQVITSTGQDECLAGSSAGMSITGGIVHSEDDMDGTEDNRGPEKGGQEVDKDKKPKCKAHHASLYTAQHKDGTFYHVRMESELGEEYCKLPNKTEKKAFILAHRFPKGNCYGA